MALVALTSSPASVFLLFMVLAIEPVLPLIPFLGTASKPVGALVFLVYLAHIPQYRLRLNSVHRVLLLFWIFAAISIFWAQAPSFALQGILTLTFNLGIIIVFYNLIRSPHDLRLACAGLIAGAVLASLLLQLGYGSVQQGTLSGTDSLSYRMSLGGENPVRIAYSLLLGWFAILYFLAGAKPWTKVILLAMGLFILYAMLATQSRTSLATAVVAPAIGYALVADRRAVLNLLGVYASLLLVGAVLYYSVFNTDILSEVAKDRMRRMPVQDLADSGRKNMWGLGLRIFLDRPMAGAGFKNFSPVVGNDWHISSAHNNAIALMAELGLIGIALATLAHFRLLKLIRKGKGTAIGWFGACMLSFAFLTGLTSTTFHKKHFWYAVGVAIVASSLAVTQKRLQDEDARTVVSSAEDEE
jgi:hypothetical protein